MKKSLLAGLIVAAGCSAGHSAHACQTIWITNSTGSPPVVQGSTVQLIASAYSPEVAVYLDSNPVAWLVDVTNPPGTPLFGPVQLNGVPVGPHTLYTNWEACVVNFTVVPLGAPGTPALSSNLTHTLKGHPFILSWTVPSGTINHYTVSKSVNSGSPTTFVEPASVTSLSSSPFVPPGEIYLFTHSVRACASSDESVCGAWSNAVSVEVDNPDPGN